VSLGDQADRLRIVVEAGAGATSFEDNVFDGGPCADVIQGAPGDDTIVEGDTVGPHARD